LLAEQVAQEADGNPTLGNSFSGLYTQPLSRTRYDSPLKKAFSSTVANVSSWGTLLKRRAADERADETERIRWGSDRSKRKERRRNNSSVLEKAVAESVATDSPL